MTEAEIIGYCSPSGPRGGGRELSTLESPADHSRLHSSEAWATLAMAASSPSQNSLVAIFLSTTPQARSETQLHSLD